MARRSSETRTAPLVSACVGAALVLVGSFGLVGLFFIGNSRSGAAERALISVGLAGSVLLSALAQGMVVVGLWLLWRAARRRAS